MFGWVQQVFERNVQEEPKILTKVMFQIGLTLLIGSAENKDNPLLQVVVLQGFAGCCRVLRLTAVCCRDSTVLQVVLQVFSSRVECCRVMLSVAETTLFYTQWRCVMCCVVL